MLTGCVLLDSEGARFHPGPPTGPNFEGLVSFMLLEEQLAGGGAYVVHPDVERHIPVALLFQEARKELDQPNMSGLHLFIRLEDEGKWTLKGNQFVLPSTLLGGLALTGLPDIK
jgi:hypothetical protein